MEADVVGSSPAISHSMGDIVQLVERVNIQKIRLVYSSVVQLVERQTVNLDAE